MYNTVLYIHLLAVVGAFFGMGLMLNSLIQVRSSVRISEALRCIALSANAAKIMPLATLLLLATGAYMTQDRWTWRTPWIVLSIIGLLLVTFFGAGVLGSRERAAHSALQRAGGDVLEAEVAAQLRTPFLVVGSGFNAGVVCAVMFVMVDKPGLFGSVAALVIGAVAGAGIFAIASRPRANVVMETN
jgi:hypothetical protein